MYTVPENLEPLQWLDGDVEFLAMFLREEKRNEFISAYKRTSSGI